MSNHIPIWNHDVITNQCQNPCESILILHLEEQCWLEIHQTHTQVFVLPREHHGVDSAILKPRSILRHTYLTHWGRVTHVCVSKLTINGSDNGLSPSRHQAIFWNNVRILLIRQSGTNFNEILMEVMDCLSRKSVWKCRLRNGIHFCLSISVLRG